MTSRFKNAASWAVIAACAAASTPVIAQEGPAEPAVSEVEAVIVTARKREEADIAVPVSITALGAAQIEREAIFSIHDLAQRTPTLTMSTTGSASGGTVYIRGIGTTVNTVGSIDQSVSFDIDGVPVSRGNILRIGEYDLESIQMLKGPQALFFGKNSPAGVIAFTSKDPTEELDMMVKLGYEPFGKTRIGEFAISGPVTDTLRARLFARYAKSDGIDKNLASLALPANQILPNAVFAPSRDRAWGYEDRFVRATIVWEPTDRFSARLKAAYDDMDADGIGSLKERFYCPQGRPQLLTSLNLPAPSGFGLGANPALAAQVANAVAVDDCRINGTIYQGNMNPAQLTPAALGDDPDGEMRSRTVVASAEFNYALTDHVDLTAVSGYVRITERNYDHFGYGVLSPGALAFQPSVYHRQFTQEVRLQTSFETPINFMLGGFYQHAFLTTYSSNFAVPPFNVGQYEIPNDVWSGFGQVTWDITPELELAAGVRYTEEKKELRFLRDFVAQAVPVPDVTFTDTSPEATITWRPTSDMTLYAAYKTGFKSGGYPATIAGNFPSIAPGDLRFLPYLPEQAEGFEVGWKAQLFNRSLRLDATIYDYEYKNIQVSNTETVAGTPVLRIFNAAAIKQKGVEIEAAYYPPAVPGLRLRGMVNYNDAKYSAFLAPCWVGQAVAEGCNQDPLLGPTGALVRFQKQDLQGRRVNDAPLWVASLGFNYSRPVADMRFEFGGDTVYKTAYNPTQELIPHARQKASTVLNAQFRVVNEEKGWEFGVYAKNLTDERRALEYSSVPLTGVANSQGSPLAGLGARADLTGNVTPGRTVLFQLVLRPSMWMQ